MKKLSLLFLFLFFCTHINAQTPVWGFNIGGTGADVGQACTIAPNGNILVTGRFSGTVDLDPGAGVYNIVSNGATDIFLACYTPSGGFLWGFGIGGANSEGGYSVTTDAAGNVIICGFIQSSGIDFDPGAGVSTMSFAGGTGVANEGDGFIAKYSFAGAFQWAKDLGGSTPFDKTYQVVTDGAGNIFAGGCFNSSMAIPGGPTLTCSAGDGYLVKFNPSGAVIWAHNFGQYASGGQDCIVFSLAVRGSTIYACGQYLGTADFNPWGTSALLTTTGSYDGYLAKYDTAGNFISVQKIGGAGADAANALCLDAAGNIYISGYSNSTSIVFNPSSPGTSTVSAPGGGGNWDITLAKYSNSGTNIWGTILGSSTDEFGYGLDVTDSFLYLTGQFGNTVDFDPSAGVANLTSSGGKDLFVAKYDLSSNYICAFRVGTAALDDIGNSIIHDTTGKIYVTGQFGGTATDFDPSAASYPLTSAGSTDGFLVKYNYTGPPLYTGTLTGDTICAGATAHLTLHITSGPSSPYSITYTDGTSSFTNAGVTSGIPFAISPSPASTATYTVTSATYTGAGMCNAPTVVISTPATVLVNTATALISPPSVNCDTITYTSGTAGTAYNWSFGDGTTGTGTPATHIYTVSGVYIATLSVTQSGCSATDTNIISLTTPAPISGSSSVCVGNTITLSDAAAGGTWVSSASGIASVGSAAGIVTGISAGVSVISYLLSNGCVVVKTVTVNAYPVITGSLTLCNGSTTVLSSSMPGGTWSSTNPAVAVINAAGVVTGLTAGTATIICFPVALACSTSVVVTVNPSPSAIAGTLTICQGDSTALSNSLPGGSWSSGNPGVVTVGTSTGMVTGISAGTSVITYMMPGTGCYKVAVVTVNPNPATIGGTMSLCAGATTLLTDGTAGGAWSSNNPAVAIINPLTGMVTGMSAGTATDTYKMPGGCYVTAVVTVNPVPSAIGGPAQVCVGAAITLTDAISGGAWSSGNPAMATVNTVTGTVTGVAAGTVTDTYKLPSGCYVTSVVTVNVAPSPVSGLSPLCIGTAETFTDAVPGGTWSSSAPGVASAGTLTGLVTALSAGTTIITYANTCGYVTIITTINPPLSVISGAAPVCVGGSVSLTATPPGGIWSCVPVSVATVSATGVVTGIAGGTVVVTYTSFCTAIVVMANAVVTVNPLPVITGTMILCQGTTTTLTGSPPGGSWTSSNPGITAGLFTGIISGSTTGTAIITYTSAAGCYTTTVVTVNAAPAPILGTLILCAGSATTFTDATAGGTWSSSVPGVASAGSSTGLITGVSAGTSVITYANACGYVTAVVTINPSSPVITGTGPLCVGSSLLLGATPPGGIWSCTPVSVATVSPIGVVTGIAGGTVAVTYISFCGAAAVIASAIVTVNPLPVITGPMVLCQGATTILTGSPAGGSWTSSNPGITAGLFTGIISGSTAGTAIVTYTSPAGCYTTAVVTVNAAPAPIIGTFILCAGSATILTDATAGGTWTSSSPGVALVDPVTGGVVALSAGTATISYTLGATGCRATAIFTVTPAPSAIMGSTVLCAGGTTVLGDAVAGGTWTSSDPGIAVIDAVTGIVTGVSAGIDTITYTISSGCLTTVIVTVNPSPAVITGILAICPGASATLGNSVLGGTWTSSVPAIAIIGTSSGTVIALLSGTTTIIYTLSSGCAATVIFTVYPLPSLITGPVSLCAGGSITLGNATPGGGSWASSNPGVASIGPSSGIVSGISPGTAAITFTSTVTGCIALAIVTVNPAPLPITGSFVVCLGNTTTLADAIPGGVWTSSNSFVAPVSAASGIVTGAGSGTANITYTLPTGCYVIAPVTVNPLPLPITGTTVICAGSVTALHDAVPGGTWSSGAAAIAYVDPVTGVVTSVATGTATITYTLASGCYITAVVTIDPPPSAISGILVMCAGSNTMLSEASAGGVWSSSSPGIASVSATGMVSGLSAGTAVISYSVSTVCFSTVVVTVNPMPSAISGVLHVCTGGSTVLFNAYPGGTWTTSATGIISIDAATGVVNGLAPGTAIVTYTLAGGCMRTVVITVEPVPAAVITAGTVCVGSTIAVTSTVTGGVWTSASPLVAAIGALSGVITGVSAGTALISYVSPGGCATAFIVTVNPTPPLITGTAAMCVGASSLLADSMAGGVWSSSDPAVATIGSSGFVSGISSGTANITYMLVTGCYRILAVTVNPLPAPIGGIHSICIGGTVVTLTDAMPGGTWSSSAPAIANINPVYGTVTGYMPGTAIITYTLPTGCLITALIIISPPPPAILGPGDVCAGQTISLFDPEFGGTWSSGTPSVATVNFFTGTVTGIYIGTTDITYTLSTGCYTTAPVFVHPMPTIVLPASSTACHNGSVSITAWGAGTGSTYTWSPATGLSCTVCAVTASSVTVAVTYTVSVVDMYGCTTSGTTTVIPDTAINHLSVSGRDSICKGASDTLYTFGFNSNFSAWGPGVSCSSCANAVISPSVTASFYAVAVDAAGCRDSASFIVTVMPPPVAAAVPIPVVLCPGDAQQLSASDASGGTGVSFKWMPEDGLSCAYCSDPVVAGVTSRVYTVTAISQFGCRDSIPVPVSVLPRAANAIRADTMVCSGSSVQLYASSTRANPTYWWVSPKGIDNATIPDPIVTPDSTTTYMVAISPKSCTNDTEKVTVYVSPMPVIQLSPSVTATAGTQVTLSATVTNTPGYPMYNWSPPEGLSCAQCLITVATPTVSTTTYTFTVISDNGKCSASADVTIRYACDDSQVFIPNTFTPNNDGANDRFYISAKGISLVKHIMIFDRWGEMVFEARNISPNDPMAGWDGTFRGKRLGHDVFVYVVDVECELGGTFSYKGDISIVR